MNRRTIVIAASIAAVAVFAAAGVLYDRFGRSPSATMASSNAHVRPHSPVMGALTAPVTIVEFFDPACESCRAFYPAVKQILGMFPGEARLVLRYAPFHKGSDEAVRILEAARLQNLFVPVLESMLARQPVWASHHAPDIGKAWEAAQAAGLDVARARRDMTAPAIDTVLRLDTEDLKAANVNKTPTFFVNGKPLMAFSPQGLYELVKSEVEAMKGGVRR